MPRMTHEERERAAATLDARANARAAAAQSGEPAGMFADLEAEAAVTAEGTAGRVVLTCAADVEPEPVRWLWQDWLALGKLHLLAGAPGAGKTTIALALAASVTAGGRFPDGSRCSPGSVLIWSGEDDVADTLLPRLIAAGADRARVFFVTGARIGTRVEPFDPARDLPALRAEAERIGDVRLVVVDPIVNAITGDSHKNSEVRRGLQPLVDMAANIGAAVLGITHLSKSTEGKDPAMLVNGSIAFTAVARVVLVAGKVRTEDGSIRRIFARAKLNIGPDEGGFIYSLEQCEPLPEIVTSRVLWGEAVKGSARELLAEPDGSGEEERSAVDAAADFLRQALAAGTAPSKTIEAEARAAGVAWRTVRRAADALHVIKRKGDGGWYWKLPDTPGQGVQPVQGVQLSREAETGQVGREEPVPGQVVQKSTSENVGQVGQHGQVGQVETVAADDTETF